MIALQQYWRNTLLVLIILLGIVIFREFWPFLSGFMGAVTIYILGRKQMFYFIDRKKMKPAWAALIILLEVLLCILIPSFLAIWLLLGRLDSIKVDPMALVSTVQHLIALIQDETGYNLLSPDSMGKLTSYVYLVIQFILNQLGIFVVNAVVLLFILYFMLISNRRMERYLYELMPFSDHNKGYLAQEIKKMVTANAIGIPLLAVSQGIIAMIGYMIFGAPSPVLFAFITCFATIIPFLGTALVWFPLALYLGLTGNWPAAIGLAAYSLVLISNVDNLLRFLLQKKMADTHPLITVFGVIIGLTLFGFWGVIFGPLLLSIFFILVDMFKKEYLENRTWKGIE